MGMVVNISSRSENLHVAASGQFSLAEAKASFLEIINAIREYKVGKVLIDGRDLIGEPRLMERFSTAILLRMLFATCRTADGMGRRRSLPTCLRNRSCMSSDSVKPSRGAAVWTSGSLITLTMQFCGYCPKLPGSK